MKDSFHIFTYSIIHYDGRQETLNQVLYSRISDFYESDEKRWNRGNGER